MLESDGQLQIEQNSTTKAAKRTRCTRNQAACFSALKLLGVKAKWFLMLECILIFLVMTPLVHVAYDHIQFNEIIRSVSWGISYCLSALFGLSVWLITHPKRYHAIWTLLTGAIMTTIIMLSELAYSCIGTLIAPKNTAVYVIRMLSPYAATAISFIVVMLLYQGPIRSKGVFVCACILPFVPVIWRCFSLANEFIDSFVLSFLENLVPVLAFLMICGVGFFGGHIFFGWCWKSPGELIRRPERAFTGFVAATLPLASSGFLIIFFTIFASIPEGAVTRTFVWLGFKTLAFVTTKIWAKIAYYGMRDDIQAMLVVFMMVMTLQFLTELMFIKIEPFKLEFFMMLLLKAALHIAIKGGLMLKMHHKLSHCIAESSLQGTCCGRFLHKFTQIISGRGPPHFHMHVTKRQGHVVQKFLAELLYSDMTLTSSVVAALGCMTVVGTELLLLQCFPETFHRGLWTSTLGSDYADGRWSIFFAYMVVMIWNIFITHVVLWLYLNDSSRVAVVGALHGVSRNKTTWIKKMRTIASTFSSGGESRTVKVAPLSRIPKHMQKNKSSASDTAVETESSSSTEPTNVLQQEFFKAKMELHVFEQALFHKQRLLFYFWNFFVIFTVMLRTSQRQYFRFESECEKPRHYGPYTNLFFHERPQDSPLFPSEFHDREGQYYDKSGCWFQVQNYSNVSMVNSDVASKCTSSKNILYKYQYNHTHFYLNSSQTFG